MSSVKTDPARRRAAIDEIYTEDCVFYDPSKGVYRGRDEIDRIAGTIKATHPEFRYQPITEPAESGNGGLVRWDQAPRVRRQLTRGPISSLPGTAGLPPFISFSTSYPELNSVVLRHTDNERFVGKPEVILGLSLFGGQVVSALLFCVGLSEPD